MQARPIPNALLGALLLLALAACSSERDEPEPPADAPAEARAEEKTEGPKLTAEEVSPGVYEVVTPPNTVDPRWLYRRQEQQAQRARTLQVFTDFRFADRRPESGITFRGGVVDDAGKYYKAVHYDHGCGVAVADVDGDGLLDLYLLTQLGRNELWRNLGGGRFEDLTEKAGVGVGDRISVGGSFADADNDGDPDLYVTTVREGNLLFENLGEGRFRDVTEAAGVGYAGHSSGAIFFDYDRDGLVDLFVANVGTYTTDAKGEGDYWVGFEDAFSGHLKPERGEPSRLFRNLGGLRFEDVTEKVGLVDESWSGDASAADLNEDGWPDLYLLNMQGHDQYWENDGGERFVRRSEEVFPRTSWGAMGVKIFDFENDGDLDIYVTDMHSDMAQPMQPKDEYVKNPMPWAADFLVDDGRGVYGNSFHRNEGGGRFVEVSDAVGAENYWPWGLSVGDLNADGFEDAFLASSMSFPWRYSANAVKLNERGRRFVDTEGAHGVEPRPDGRTAVHWFDIDCGAEPEHALCESTGLSAGTLRVSGALGTRSSVILDLDRDGDLDIVTNDFGAEPMLLTSDLTEKKQVHYLEVSLRGKRSNRDGIGALVTVKVGDRTLTRLQDGKSGYLSQSAMPLYVGLDAASQVDEVRVRWPSGTQQVVKGPIEANQTLVIEESDA